MLHNVAARAERGTSMIRLSLTAMLSALLVPSFAVAAAPDLPKRKSGLWEIETQLQGRPMKIGPIRQCVDEKTDDLMKQQAESATIDCSQKDWRHDGDKFIFKSVCKIMGSTATTEGVFSGDFAVNYRGETRSTFDPPMHGLSGSAMSISAKWLGPCAAGQKAGDLIMPDMSGAGGPAGGTINVEELMKMREKLKQLRPPGQ